MPITKPGHGSTPKTAILAVIGNQQELNLLRCLLTGSSWALCTAVTLADAAEQLNRTPFPVIFCERHLADGDWKALLRIANDLEHRPSVVVFSRHADDALWTEALNAGAFDVLPGAGNQKTVFRTLSNAWRSWNERKQQQFEACLGAGGRESGASV